MDEVCPAAMLTEDRGTPRTVLTSDIMALLAFPSVAGAATRHPMAFLHGLYPAGKRSDFAPADDFDGNERTVFIGKMSIGHRWWHEKYSL